MLAKLLIISQTSLFSPFFNIFFAIFSRKNISALNIGFSLIFADFSIHLTVNTLRFRLDFYIAKTVVFHGKSIVFTAYMSSFYVVKAMLSPPNNYAFTSQYLCFYLLIAMLSLTNANSPWFSFHFSVIIIYKKSFYF